MRESKIRKVEPAPESGDLCPASGGARREAVMIPGAQCEKHGGKFVFGEVDGIGVGFTPEIVNQDSGKVSKAERRASRRLALGIPRGVDSLRCKCRGLCRGGIQILTI